MLLCDSLPLPLREGSGIKALGNLKHRKQLPPDAGAAVTFMFTVQLPAG